MATIRHITSIHTIMRQEQLKSSRAEQAEEKRITKLKAKQAEKYKGMKNLF